MKVIMRILTLGALMLSCQTAITQNPAISSNYSEIETDNLLKEYRAAHSRDVVPSAVLMQQFRKDFSNSAYDVEWEMAGNIYEVDFEIGKKDYQAYYDADGGLLMYTVEITASDVPAMVKDAAKAKYAGYRMERDAERMQKGQNTFYKVQMEKYDAEINAIFKSDGSFVEEFFD